MSNVIHLYSDDWEGLYADGNLIYENHHVPMKVFHAALKQYGTDCEFLFLTDEGIDWIETEGSLPVKFEDISTNYYD